MGIIDNVVYKYGANVIGYSLLAIPVFTSKKIKYISGQGSDASVITKDYIRNSANLINLSKALGRLVISYKDMQNLAGYTYLVSKLHTVLEDINQGKFVRTQVNEEVLNKYTGEVK